MLVKGCRDISYQWQAGSAEMGAVRTFGIGARIRAARHMAGLEGVPSLVAELQRRGVKQGQGLGRTNLYAYESGRDVPDIRDLIEIAHACEVPIEFFTADFSRLAEISDDPRHVLATEIAAARERARARRAGTDEENQPPLAEGQQL